MSETRARARVPTWLAPTLVLLGAALGLVGVAAGAAIASGAELGDWLQRMGWWSYPLRGLAVLQCAVAVALGLRALRRPVPTWTWLLLPAVSTGIGALATHLSLAQGQAALGAVDPGQRAVLWAAVLGEALPAAALGLLVAAQGGAALCLGAGLGALRLAPVSATRPRGHAIAVAAGGLVLATTMGAWLTGSFGDADVARLAWLDLWLCGLGFALVPAVLGASGLAASPHPDERGAGLRLAAQSTAGAVLALVATAAALWVAHVAQALLALAQVDTVGAPALALRALAGLSRTLGSAGLATLLVLVLATLVLGPLLARARPGTGAAGGALVAAGLVGVAALSVAGSTGRAVRLGDDVLDLLGRRAPAGRALAAFDVERLHVPEWPLLELDGVNARLDGRHLAGPLAAGDLAQVPDTSCPAVAVAAPATLRARDLAPWLQALRALGICEVRLVVERVPVAIPVDDSATWPPVPRALRRAVWRLAALRFERWGVVPVRLVDEVVADPGAATPGPDAPALLSIASTAIVASSATDARIEVDVASDGSFDLGPLVARWRTLAERQALPAQLTLQVDQDVPLARLLAVVDAAQFAARGSEVGADPFGHDPAVQREPLHARVLWMP